mmetsp:Transcript_4881/g.11737  ORF Transcript_4881/g.11737 Transcript_4881/m.11737 type:complete len:284 (+) Transcript_4881:800-1651(+)
MLHREGAIRQSVVRVGHEAKALHLAGGVAARQVNVGDLPTRAKEGAHLLLRRVERQPPDINTIDRSRHALSTAGSSSSGSGGGRVALRRGLRRGGVDSEFHSVDDGLRGECSVRPLLARKSDKPERLRLARHVVARDIYVEHAAKLFELNFDSLGGAARRDVRDVHPLVAVAWRRAVARRHVLHRCHARRQAVGGALGERRRAHEAREVARAACGRLRRRAVAALGQERRGAAGCTRQLAPAEQRVVQRWRLVRGCRLRRDGRFGGLRVRAVNRDGLAADGVR